MDKHTQRRLKHQIASYEAIAGGDFNKKQSAGCLVIPLGGVDKSPKPPNPL